MLITNFAAGELSETLFGRTDLPQYYQGVSFLENFEVIPTGGVERRNGTKRVREMEGEGRIIPFILDREESFLLYLMPQLTEGGVTTPARIQIYRDGVKQGDDITDSTAAPLPRTMAEIEEAQYAQNYSEMVLVHENYHPLHIRLIDAALGSKTLQIVKLAVSGLVDVEKSGSDEDKGVYTPAEIDAQYNNKYLTTQKNYPRAVSFFNGRLIFAGTRNNPQRLFAGRVGKKNDTYNFASYTLFLTFSRNYISVYGTIDIIKKTFTPADLSEFSKFTENYRDYYAAPQFFPEGTMVAGMNNGALSFTKDPVILEFGNWEMGEFLTWRDLMNNNLYPVWFGPYLIYSNNDTGSRPVLQLYTEASVNLASLTVRFTYYEGNPPEGVAKSKDDYFIGDSKDIENYIKNPSALEDWIRSIAPEVSRPAKFEDFISAVKSLFVGDEVHHYLYYTITDTKGIPHTFYGLADSIYQQILGNEASGASLQQIYMSFYTIKIIEDRYPTPDNGFTFEIASDMSDAIRWICQNKNLLVGSETAEWVIPSGVTAVNVQAALNSRYGSDRIQGTSVGDAMCFFQSGRKALIEYYIPQQDNNFRANNMAMFSKNMLHESAAFDFDFISAPYTKLFVSREDGIIAALLYERGTGTFAWGRIRTGGRVTSVAATPGPSGYDDVYLIVKRENGTGGAAHYLEMLAERRRSDDSPDAEVFLDSYLPWEGSSSEYTALAAVYSETDRKTYPAYGAPAPIAGHIMWIGYPYTSRLRSMPVLANDRMKQNIIKNLYIRFTDSFMPKVRAVSVEEGAEREGNTDRISRKEPYSGIVHLPFPGVWDRDVFFELIHDTPTRCRVLAVNAEVN